MVSLATIKNWFRTGLKPTQAQFWDTWDSFWHKDDAIPTSSISGLDTIIGDLPSSGQLDMIDLLTPLIVPVAGTASQALDADILLEVVILIGTGTWKVGTTGGGSEIFEDTVSGYGVYRIDFYRTSAVTLHFTGTGTAKLYRR